MVGFYKQTQHLWQINEQWKLNVGRMVPHSQIYDRYSPTLTIPSWEKVRFTTETVHWQNSSYLHPRCTWYPHGHQQCGEGDTRNSLAQHQACMLPWSWVMSHDYGFGSGDAVAALLIVSVSLKHCEFVIRARKTIGFYWYTEKAVPTSATQSWTLHKTLLAAVRMTSSSSVTTTCKLKGHILWDNCFCSTELYTCTGSTFRWILLYSRTATAITAAFSESL